MATERARWGSRYGFVLAAAGSAVGLGNIWRFPYMTGENGGGWFVLMYLVCVALVGVPVMMAEIMIGRAAQKQPVVAFAQLQGGRTAWAGVGWLGVLAGFIILSYYIVVAGWAMDYTLKSVVNFSRPIHEAAELEAAKHRAGSNADAMRRELAVTLAQRTAAPPIAQIRNTLKPSFWRNYAQYTQALASAGAVDVVRVEALQEVWGGQTAPLLESLELADAVGSEITDSDRQRHAEVRVRLIEKAGFEASIPEAESRIEPIESVRLAHVLEAVTHYDALSDPEVRAEAETLKRRQVMRQKIEGAFGSVAGDGWTSTFWMIIFMTLTITIVASGVSSGIERACAILMPALFALILVLVVYGFFQSGFTDAIRFVFKPDATKLKPSSVLAAMGQAFFSLSLGMGAMITYGSYQQSKQRLAGQSVTIAALDTSVALLACLMIFPIVFSFGQEPSAGPGLVFMSMPLAFAEIGQGGMFLGTIFFGLLVFAALTSSISLLEVVVSYFIDQWGWSRVRASWLLGGIILLFGVPSAFGGDADFAMSGWSSSYGKDFLSTMDYLASNWMLPLGGLLIAVYAGWFMPRKIRAAELQGLAPLLLTGWLILVRFVAPALVVLILLQSIGILDADELFHGMWH